ncbi:MAG: universal stress protein [Bacillota bacterium]|uniref:universal stress protein n=1 Tax=Desulforudis sp. DRI-14 TaxID=3459793 RepID=UPI003493A9D3
MKILVPVDGSEQSMRAVAYALKKAKDHPSIEVTLLTVAYQYDVTAFDGAVLLQQLATERSQEVFKEKLEEAKKVFDAAGVKVNAELLVGDPASVIISYVEKKDIDEVIMGSRGMSPLKAAVIGSVTYKVLQNVDVPVLVVK